MEVEPDVLHVLADEILLFGLPGCVIRSRRKCFLTTTASIARALDHFKKRHEALGQLVFLELALSHKINQEHLLVRRE